MIEKKYLDEIRKIVTKYLEAHTRIFIFGSSIAQNEFHDIDVGIIDGIIETKNLSAIREELENSTIPYKVDVIDFNRVDAAFREKVFKEKVLWLTYVKNYIDKERQRVPGNFWSIFLPKVAGHIGHTHQLEFSLFDI